MQLFKHLPKKSLLCTIVFVISAVVYSQDYKLDNTTSFMKIEGTSSLHDWHIDVEKQAGSLVLEQSETINVKAISLTVESESLKSGKSRMDKNTYKALETDDYKKITFKLIKTTEIKKLSDGIYEFNGVGELTIVGNTKEIAMSLKLEIKDGMVLISGKNEIKMTDFGVEPPTALLGTIKTGDAITISYKSTFKTK
ncbi:YceI family protein [Winogradskyella aquimaris]|uniref:YceI family protein n=1 Tax=Winogradskyella aquimaris TaxID=864074 RepID=A0ABU5ENX8_9FLAO|nr:YceI family protein [Winogradskyella aquimaris]MDY2588159.1 YceI family protein [Winogradskyella aquimaris]